MQLARIHTRGLKWMMTQTCVLGLQTCREASCTKVELSGNDPTYHARAGSTVPTKDVTEQWYCKANLRRLCSIQALGIHADWPVRVVPGEAI